MFNINDRVKLNEELCPENKRTEKKYQFGALNYFALFLEWEFEIERVFTDDYHGEMMECKVLNVDNIHSNIVLKAADVVLASKKMLKMDFEIVGLVNKNQMEIDKLKDHEKNLVELRSKEKTKGVSISTKKMIDNWNEIKSTRARIKKLEEAPEKIFRVKHKIGIFDIDCKEEQIPNKLRQVIRSIRADQKRLIHTKKEIAGGQSLEKIGGVMSKAGKFLELNEKYATVIIKEHKTPKTTDNYVGIEIEMISPKNIDAMQKEFIKARLHKYVNIGTDGSIHSDQDGVHTMELRVCLPENLLQSKLKEICDVLRKNDCYVNRSCGTHVHLDMRQRNPELCYRNFFKVLDIMMDSQPATRRKNKYCKPNTKAELKLDQFSSGSDSDRYVAINTQSYHKNNMKTIEIRIHEGIIKFKDIYNWVQFLVSTASLTTDLSKPIKNIKDLKEANYVPSNVVSHLEERIEEFSA